MASCLRGYFPPVDLRAVCLVRAMVGCVRVCFGVLGGEGEREREVFVIVSIRISVPVPTYLSTVEKFPPTLSLEPT